MKRNESHNNRPFNTPKDYFDSFEERLFTHDTFQNAIPKSHGFNTPENYFDSLTDKVMSLVEEANERRPWYRKYWYASAVAALVVVGLLVFNLNGNSSAGLEDVNIASIENYLDESFIEFDDDDISALLEENSDFSFNYNIDEEALIDYLDVHLEDASLIIE